MSTKWLVGPDGAIWNLDHVVCIRTDGELLRLYHTQRPDQPIEFNCGSPEEAKTMIGKIVNFIESPENRTLLNLSK